jgi:hypothetical protein
LSLLAGWAAQTLRLNPSFLGAIYALFATLFASGATWLVADALKEGDGGEAWQAVAANLLMIHGGASMVTLVLLGALYPLHMRLGWRANRNRISGSVMVTINGLLIVTAFGLYYSGAEVLRAWTGYIHIAAGLALPVLAGLHILLGRRSRPK